VKPSEPVPLPTVVVGVEAYGRVARLLGRKDDVELEVDVKARFTDEDPLAASNVFGEIPGTGQGAEGRGRSDRRPPRQLARRDRRHRRRRRGGDGPRGDADPQGAQGLPETDDPRRPLGGRGAGSPGLARLRLEGAGLAPEPTDSKERETPEFLRRPTGPLTFKPGYAKFDAYFNVDNGAGKIRGIFAQDNAAVVPIFESWLAPFKDLGATTSR